MRSRLSRPVGSPTSISSATHAAGFPEVIFRQGKTAVQIESILRTLIEHGQGGLVTRIDAKTGNASRRCFPKANTTR